LKILFSCLLVLLVSGCQNDDNQRTSTQVVSISEASQLSKSSNVYTSSVLDDGTILFGGENGLSISYTSNNRDNKSNFQLPIFLQESDQNSTNRSNDENETKVKIFSIVNSSSGVFIGGSFNNVNGTPRNNLVKLNSNGLVNEDFNNSINGAVFKIIEIDENNLLVAGSFGGYDDNIAHSIAKISKNGVLDKDFIPFNEYLFVKINDVAKLDANKYILAGTFVKEAGETDENTTKEDVISMTSSIVVLNTNGSIDEELTSKFSKIKNEAFVVEVDNSLVYIGGNFTFSQNDYKYTNLVAFSLDGELNEEFKIETMQGLIFDTKISGDTVIFAGDFLMPDSSSSRSFYIVDKNGITIKVENFSVDADIYSIDVYEGSLILSGEGNFAINGNDYSNNIALKLQ